MISFRQWLEGVAVTSLSQVRMIPTDGNADWNRSDVHSKYSAQNTGTANLPPGDGPQIKKFGPEAKFGFNTNDRKNVKPRNEPNLIDRNRKDVPLRITQIYT